MNLLGHIRHVETWLSIDCVHELAVAQALMHTQIPELFATGAVRIESDRFGNLGLVFHIKHGGKVLAALQNLDSFRKEGGAAQRMFALGRRLHGSVVN